MLVKIKKKIMWAISSLYVCFCSCPVYAYYLPKSTTVTSNLLAMDADDFAEKIGGVVGAIALNILAYAGQIILVFGILEFGLSLRNEDTNEKTRAFMTMICGLILMTFRSILSDAGIIA